MKTINLNSDENVPISSTNINLGILGESDRNAITIIENHRPSIKNMRLGTTGEEKDGKLLNLKLFKMSNSEDV